MTIQIQTVTQTNVLTAWPVNEPLSFSVHMWQVPFLPFHFHFYLYTSLGP